MRAHYLEKLDAFLSYYDLPGKEPMRVYLHGLGLAAAGCFAHIATHPALGGHRSLLVDFLGHGSSDHPEKFSYSMEDHAGTVISLLDALQVRACEWVGYSMGGTVAICIAARRPDLVSKLVVVEPNLEPGPGALSGPIAKQTREEYVQRGFAADVAGGRLRARGGDPQTWWNFMAPAQAAVVTGMFQLGSPLGVHASAVELVAGTKPTARERLLGLKIPRAYVIGAKTGATKLAYLKEAGVPFFTVPDAAHPMFWENPDGTAKAIAQGLASGR